MGHICEYWISDQELRVKLILLLNWWSSVHVQVPDGGKLKYAKDSTREKIIAGIYKRKEEVAIGRGDFYSVTTTKWMDSWLD